MSLNTQLAELLNTQVLNEQQASHSYLAMNAWLETTPYKGFAKWMKSQSDEEREHAEKFFGYLLTRDVPVKLGALTQPQAEYAGLVELFQISLSQEQEVTQNIRDLYALAVEVKDYETQHFLGWFLEEQMEEEEAVRDMLDRLKLAGDNSAALLQLDAEAGSREAE